MSGSSRDIARDHRALTIWRGELRAEEALDKKSIKLDIETHNSKSAGRKVLGAISSRLFIPRVIESL